MQSLKTILDGLNPQQREAVEHDSGPLLVVAGPGSGKTRVLTVRGARLLGTGVCEPGELTAVTFTNKAAAEMRGRLSLLAGAASSGAHFQTFHSMCLRVLRQNVRHLPDFNSRFVVYDEKDVARIFKQIRLDIPTLSAVEGGATLIDHWKHCGIRAEDAPDSPAGRFYREYQRRITANNAMDFGDLILRCIEVMKRVPSVLARCRSEARFLMVDEYQDTNPIQYQLVQLLGGSGFRNVCVVGDPDQSIYAFRGADIGNILRFTEDFSGCRVIALERNYRSTKTILAATNKLISHNEDRIDKEMWTEMEHDEPIRVAGARTQYDETVRVARLVQAEVASGVAPRDIGVIARTRNLTAQAERELRLRRVPCEIIGATGFYDRREIRDVLAYLRLIENPFDGVAFARIINQPRRGIGPKTLSKIQRIRLPGEDPIQAAERCAAGGLLGTRAANAVMKFMYLLLDLTEIAPSSSPEYFFDEVLTRTGYVALLESEEDGEKRSRYLGHLRDLFAREGQPGEGWRQTLMRFLDTVKLNAHVKGEDSDLVQIMTAHSSKGLEYSSVFVVGASHGLLPHRSALKEARGMEEERRLAFVAMTRAKRRLCLGWHKVAHGRNGEVIRGISPFIKELGKEHLTQASRRRPPPSALLSHFVEHPTFGRGLVIDQHPTAGSVPLLVVNFMDAGRKVVTEASVRLA